MTLRTDFTDNTGDVVDAAYLNQLGTEVNARPGKYTATIGDGSTTSIVVTHGLGTLACVCSVRESSGGVEVDCDKTYNSTTQITLGFQTAPATNALTVTVIG